MREVTVKAVLNGWTVKVGCQTLVYTDIDKLTEDLREYAQNPQAKEKAMIERAVNKRILTEGPATLGEAPRPPDMCGTIAPCVETPRR